MVTSCKQRALHGHWRSVAHGCCWLLLAPLLLCRSLQTKLLHCAGQQKEHKKRGGFATVDIKAVLRIQPRVLPVFTWQLPVKATVVWFVHAGAKEPYTSSQILKSACTTSSNASIIDHESNQGP